MLPPRATRKFTTARPRTHPWERTQNGPDYGRSHGLREYPPQSSKTAGGAQERREPFHFGTLFNLLNILTWGGFTSSGPGSDDDIGAANRILSSSMGTQKEEILFELEKLVAKKESTLICNSTGKDMTFSPHRLK